MKKIYFTEDARLLLNQEGSGLYLPKEDCAHFPETKERLVVGNLEINVLRDVQYGSVGCGLREAYMKLPVEEYNAAAKGAELLHWSRQHRYCSRCGEVLEESTEISRKCPSCGMEYFPHLSPCVIVLVKKGREALLVHAKTFRRPFFGLVAGFVETGETLEEAVRREVWEETSMKIKNIRYRGSQSWPFPSQLMIGFTADYESGKLRFADGELSEGGFFTPENLPVLPTPPSIARRLIEDWVRSQGLEPPN